MKNRRKAPKRIAVAAVGTAAFVAASLVMGGSAAALDPHPDDECLTPSQPIWKVVDLGSITPEAVTKASLIRSNSYDEDWCDYLWNWPFSEDSGDSES